MCLLEGVRDRLLSPLLVRVIQPLARLSERQWPLVSCAFAWASAALFARSSATAMLLFVASLPDGWGTARSHLIPIGCTAAAAYATSSVGLLLAGYCMGGATLRWYGEYCVRHIDLGLTRLVGSLVRSASTMGGQAAR